MRKIYVLALCLLSLSLMGCGDDNSGYIPPALDERPGDEPDEPGDDVVYNKPEFTPHVEGEPYDTYRGLVMAGYQGWFGAPGDGCSHGDQWYHYQENGMFEPGVLRNSIDFWPDMSEYEKQYETDNFYYPDGKKATVYSAYDKSSVLLHFKWMKDYGLDGVFMQRFVGEVIDNPAGKDHFDKVLASAMEGSDTYQRAICVMYDLGGYTPERKRKVLDDAQDIYDKYASTRKYYLHEDGKPMLALWGVGFKASERGYTNSDIQELVDALKGMGYSIMLGVTTYWRAGGGDTDASDLANLHALVKSANVIMPWFVGRYDRTGYPNFHSLIEQDVAWCRENGVEYAPLCHPGSSDRNMHPDNTVVPREGGGFYWDQIYQCVKSGAQMLYIAMFDEIDEGTAIYKCLNTSDVPGNEPPTDYYVVFQDGGYRLSANMVEGLTGSDWCKKASELDVVFQGIEDGLPTDHYLWLTGQARKMLHGEIPLSKTLPVRE